jgi:hypothetical protein
MRNSQKKLEKVNREIEKILMENFDLEERPAFVVSMSIPPGYKHAYYFMNVSAGDGILLCEQTAIKLKAQNQ